MEYKVSDGQLEIRVGDSVAWKDTFDNGEVIRAMGLPGTEDCVVLVESSELGAERNLLRVRPDGRIAWRAVVAPEGGPYTEVQIQEGRIVAWSWTGYCVKLDSATGVIIDKDFAK